MMTKEEAKSEIMQIYGALSPNKQRAIDTLVKIEPCEDAVSRKAVLDTLMKCEEPCEDRQDFYLDSTTEFAEKIKELPPVTPKLKTGHWIKSDKGFLMYECSECEAVTARKSKYCPNCGAKMESEG